MNRIKAATVQFNHKAGDKARNLAVVRDFTAQAAGAGVDLLVFPEMCITGYWHVRNLTREQVAALAEPVPDGPSTHAVAALAAAHGMTIGAGLIELAPDGLLYNTYIVALPDGRVERHRKLHCFVSAHMASGNAYTVFDSPQGFRAGVLICYDNNIVENVRMTALLGADVLLAPHQTGGCRSPDPHTMGAIAPELWHKRREEPDAIEAEFRGPKGREWLMRWLPTRAHDNGLFLVYSNGVGLDDDEVRTGNAMIIDPYGRIRAETCRAGDDMVVAELDPALREANTGRRWIKSRRPELYRPLGVPTGQEMDTRTLRFDGCGV